MFSEVAPRQRESRCGVFSLWKTHEHRVHTLPTRCKAWKCETCGPRKARSLKLRARSGLPTTFLTLTSRRGLPGGRHAAAKRLSQCWRLMRQQLRRDGIAEHIPFLAVFESTQAGWPHLHILLRAPYIPVQRISQLMARWHDSPIVHIEKVDSAKKAAAYVAKYMAKSPERFHGTKRWWCSRDWTIDESIYNPHRKPDGDWHMSKAALRHIRRMIEEEDLKVYSESAETIVFGTPDAFTEKDVLALMAHAEQHRRTEKEQQACGPPIPPLSIGTLAKSKA